MESGASGAEGAVTPRAMTPLSESTRCQLDALATVSNREDNASDGVHTVGSSELNPLQAQGVPEASALRMPSEENGTADDPET